MNRGDARASGIRAAVRGDIPRLAAIRAEVRENRLDDPSRIRAADYAAYIDAGRCWVWQEGKTVLGFAALDAAAGSLWALFVAPAAAGRGIGRALLAHALDEAARLGLNRLRLTTGPGTRAERLYRRAGWAVTGREPSGDLVMRIDLRGGGREDADDAHDA